MEGRGPNCNDISCVGSRVPYLFSFRLTCPTECTQGETDSVAAQIISANKSISIDDGAHADIPVPNKTVILLVQNDSRELCRAPSSANLLAGASLSMPDLSVLEVTTGEGKPFFPVFQFQSRR